MRFPGATALMPMVCAVLCVSVLPVLAATLRVEQDDSGDYTVIQDALDAVASGDTVLVGPGRYETFRLRTSTTNGFQFQSIAHMTTADIVLSGSSVDSTIIGPAFYVDEIDGKVTVGVTIDTGGMPGTVTDLHIVGVLAPVIIRTSNAVVRDCSINNRGKSPGDWAIRVNRGIDSVIRRCHIQGPDGIITGAGGVQRLLIEECSFDDESLNGFGVTIGNGATDCTIRRCTFTRGAASVQFSLFSSGWVEDCTFQDVRITAVDLSSGAAVVRRCMFKAGMRRPLSIGDGRLEVYDSVIGGGTSETIGTCGETLVEGCHILPGDSLTVNAPCINETNVVLSGNWWGTTDSTAIWDKIYDPGNRVSIESIAQEPLAQEQSSVGRLKAQYGPRK